SISGADGIRTHYLLTASQIAFRQNPLDKKFSKCLYLGESRAGGKYNVDTKSNETCLLNKKGGGNHEDPGGCN
ncbi:unnamed protein product, partial [marine sediment metagenome]